MTARLPVPVLGLSLLIAAPLSAQLQGPTPAPAELAAAFGLRNATVQDLQLPNSSGRAFQVDVVLGDHDHTLQLQPYDVRAPGFVLLVDDGTTVHRVPAPPCATYRGEVVGHPGSLVTATLVNGQLEALVHLGNELWGIDPAGRAIPGLPWSSHIVYDGTDVVAAGHCGTTETTYQRVLGGAQTPQAAATKEAELALDLNFPFYVRYNRNVTSATNGAMSIINGADTIYQRDVSVQFKVTATIVRTTSVYSASGSNLLNQFANRWNSQHTNVQRDLAHMFTGASGSSLAGIATLATVCNRGSAYGVTWWEGSLAARVAVAAHEMGHNFSADHCSGSGCYIMCPVLGQCGRRIDRFGTASKNRISSFAASRGCLSNVSTVPQITSISPSSVPSHNAPVVTINGTSLDSATKITVGSVEIAQFAKQPTSVTFSLPDPFEIAQHNVTVTNSSGTSNTLQLTVTAPHPSQLEAPTLHPRGTFPIPYRVYTDRGWTAVLFLSTSNAPSAVQGVVSLDIGNAFASLFQIATLSADNAGLAELSLVVPTTVPPGSLYWQAVTFDGSQVAFPLETSNSSSTTYF